MNITPTAAIGRRWGFSHYHCILLFAQSYEGRKRQSSPCRGTHSKAKALLMLEQGLA
ncbi:hypothetical protein P2H89_09080 [Paraflavitalea sp. CAU 1676]|nr:hypothetical protein [Paraflavitalea sp. CAU 1676]